MIFTLAIGLTLALILGIIAQRLRLSPLLGYLVAGMIAAGRLWGVEVDAHMVEEFSHMGVVLLLFGVGIQFHFKDLLAVQKVALPAALICICVSTSLGALAYYSLSGIVTQPINCVMYGLCICVSSTVVLTRVLSDNRVMQTPTGKTALGWLVVEDIFTIILLVLLPVMIELNSSGGDILSKIAPALGWVFLKLACLILCVGLLGRHVVPRVLGYVSRSASSDLFTLSVLVLALGIAVVSAYVFNASMELGAFLSGMIVGQSRFSARAASDALPMRDAFAVLFFVSIGMGFDFRSLLQNWQLALATLSICVIIKPLLSFALILLVCRKTSRLAAGVAGSLSQIGEFSFILASLAAGKYGLIPESASHVITGVAIISITINSVCYRFIPMLICKLENRGIGLLTQKGATDIIPVRDDKHRVIVIGYGPCGQLVCNILRSYDMDVVVIEMNIDTVQELEKLGISALLGDARLRSVLETAGAAKAQAIIVSAPSAPAQQISDAARSLQPDIEVMAHTSYLSAAQSLREDGARRVFAGEEEVAISMAAFMLRSFGATEEQIHEEERKLRHKLGELSSLPH